MRGTEWKYQNVKYATPPSYAKNQPSCQISLAYNVQLRNEAQSQFHPTDMKWLSELKLEGRDEPKDLETKKKGLEIVHLAESI